MGTIRVSEGQAVIVLYGAQVLLDSSHRARGSAPHLLCIFQTALHCMRCMRHEHRVTRRERRERLLVLVGNSTIPTAGAEQSCGTGVFAPVLSGR